MSEFTEEQLLGTSPRDDDYMEQDSGQSTTTLPATTDPKVRMVPEKTKECLIQCVHKALTTISIECEKVLSKAFRTTNPTRNEIMEVMTRQIKVASEMILNAYDQVGEGEQSSAELAVEKGVFEILKVANLTSVGQLEMCLDDRLRDRETVQRLCEILRCNKGELEKRIREIVDTLEENENTIASMQDYVRKKNVQVQELTKKITMLGHAENQLEVESHGGEETHSRWSKWQRFADVSKAADNMNRPVLQDTPVLMTCKPGMHTYCSQWRNRSSGETKAAATCMWDTGEEVVQDTVERNGRGELNTSCRDDALVEFMRTAALPTIQPFYADGKQSFKSFVNAFSIRYHKPQWDDKSLVQLFESFLRKRALVTFETLPIHVKEGRFEEVVEAMTASLQEDGNAARIKAMTQLRNLSMRADQTVGEFCVVLEKLANRAYQNIPAEVVSLQKAEILFRQLAKWNGSYSLSEAIETSEGHEAYENVKKAALRLERNRMAANEMAGNRKSESHQQVTMMPTSERRLPRPNNVSRVYGTPPSPPRRRGMDTRDMHVVRGNDVRRMPTAGQVENTERRPVQCYNCDKYGHVARECRNNSKGDPRRSTAAPNISNDVRQGGSFSAWVDSLACSISVSEAFKETNGLFGQKSITDVQMMDKEVKALLDTGSEMSIIPLSVFQRARSEGINLDNYVERVPRVDAVIRNASGEVMNFADTVRMDVTMQGKTRPIAFHVGGGFGEVVILGTNALENFGLRLTMEEDKNGMTEAEQPEREVRVKERTFIPPGATKKIALMGAIVRGDHFLRSGHPLIEDGVCSVTEEGAAEVTICNISMEPKVLHKGEVIGEWSRDDWIPVNMLADGADMMEELPKSRGQQEEGMEELLAVLKEKTPMTVELEQLIRKYRDVFAVRDSELTQTDLVEHSIDTGDSPPIKQKTRPVPLGARQEFKSIIHGLLERGIITKSKSDWASPVVLVRKKDGSLRLCIDYRALNKVTKQDSYPLPTIDTVIQSLGSKKVFSTLDMASGYWQIKLSEAAKEKSAFTTSEGLFQFEVLPFGLSTSPAKFQRLMDMVLGELQIKDSEVFVYIDDILIATETAERHNEILEMVFRAFRKANLKLKPQKCEFFKRKVHFLGHIIDDSGVSTDPDKISKIKEYPAPSNVNELRTFLGMAAYYRKFILGFSRIARPLYSLTSPKAKWRWSDTETSAFEKLKEVMTQAPVLAQPDVTAARDHSRPFIIYTDASGDGVGAVLCQEGTDKMLHPLYFASKSLTKAEKNYHITDLEALAVVFALKKFHFFIYGLKTIVRTDHKPLTCLFKQTNVSARVLRWALEVQRYRLEIQYVAGKANAVADSLSRGVAKETVKEDEMNVGGEAIVAQIEVEESVWLRELEQDPDYMSVIEKVRNGEDSEAVSLPRCAKKYRIADFTIDHGDLKMMTEAGMVTVVPKTRRRAVFHEAHGGMMAGHLNGRKLLRNLKKMVFWEGMEQDIMKWSRSCRECFLARNHQQNIPPLKPITTSRPFELIGVDLVELGLSEQGNRYALVVIDHFTKFLGAYPIPDKTAKTVARTIFERWICDGCRWPKTIHSDQGPEFVNSILSEICEITGIKQSTTKGYNPRENGVTERAIGTITRMLKKKTVIPTQWDILLPMVVFAYNSAPHEAVGESPFYMLHAFDPNYPSNEIPSEHLSWNHIDFDDYKYELMAGINHINECAKELNEHYKENMKKNYDNRFKVDPTKMPRIGDRVYVKLPREKSTSKHPKLVDSWSGPFRVLEASDNSALLASIGKNEDPIRVQHDMLIKIPQEIDNTPIETKTRRVKRGKKSNVVSYANQLHCRATTTDFDNSALSPFYVCPGPGPREDDPDEYNCTIRGKRFSEVMPNESDPVIRDLYVHSVFSLARMISIYENETDIDKKRYLMRSPSYNFVTTSGAEKAYTFYKRHCDHMLKALILHDGSSIAMSTKENVNMEITQLNDLANAGIRFALEHSWEDCRLNIAKRTTLILPSGFRGYRRVMHLEPNMNVIIYRDLSDIPRELINMNGLRTCIFVTPTTDRPCSKSEWLSLGMAFTNVVRQGVKLIAVSGPRGEMAWTQNRKDAIDMLDIVRDAATAMRNNVVTTFSSVPSIAEPFACLGESTRCSAGSAYPAHSTKAFLAAMHNYVRPHLSGNIYKLLDQPLDREKAYKEKKRALRDNEDRGRQEHRTDQSGDEEPGPSQHKVGRPCHHQQEGSRTHGNRGYVARGFKGRWGPQRGGRKYRPYFH
ncbi:hypothetical protein Y032_1180g3735 [Ancylostoma ceylanicum]|uniref:RNA-directed DNA polymerase n=1 Tax=Ancylostoma ceylanicum TaxID=53326 RepID=A0A016W703_9BILA|nr:hypothetical protein Y032_1180g3735 [Ancylostoma ceylanicum]